MKDLKYYNIFPKRLTLTKEGTKLTFKAFEKKVEIEFIGLLKKNKNSILDLMQINNCHKIEILPLAQNQRSLWFIHQLLPTSSAYNIGLSLRIYNGIDTSILKNTLSVLLEKHWPLRSHIFKLKDGEDFKLCQIISDSFIPELKEVEDNFSNEKELIERINQDNNIPFDLESGPLFRTYIYYYNQSAYILFSFHHIICDAISLQLFSSDFSKIYESLKNGETFSHERDEINYSQFIFNQYNFLQSTEGKKQIEYWKNTLKNIPQTIDLPTDFNRPEIHQFNGNTIHFKIKGEIYNKIKSSAIKHKVTLSTYLFTIYQILIAQYSKQNSFCIGLPVSARTDKDYSGIFGYLINTLPIPCRINSEFNFGDILNNNSHTILTALENQDVPFSEIVNEVASQRDLSRTPIFQVLYNFLNKKALGSLVNFLSLNEEKRQYGSFDISPIKLKDQEGQFDITLEIYDDDNSLDLSLKYNTDIFSSVTANMLVEKFNKLLDEISSNPNYQIDLNTKIEKKLSINITGSFTTEPLKKGLNFWLKKMNLPAITTFVGFNQIFQQLLDPGSKFNSDTNQLNIVLIRIEDLFPDDHVKPENANTISREFIETIKSHSQNNPSNKLIIVFCPPSERWIYDEEAGQTFIQIETEIISLSQIINNIIIVHTNNFLTNYKLTDYYEPLGEEQGNIPFKDNFFACASTLIARRINAIYTSPFKAVVLDCDNTLWQGVVGEDGAKEVIIGEQEKKLQKFLIEQYNSGVLLCLCSKNNEKEVWEVFENNKQMHLKRKHISFSRINWNPKSENIINLSKEINIGLDTIVFIDDNPFECEEVKTNVPSVLTIQKRTNTDDIDYIANSWVFDKNKITEEDKKRALMYKDEAARASLKSGLKTYEEFIDGLQIKISINPVGSEEITRISQLTFRTNQFNFTKKQRTESEIDILSKKPDWQVSYVRLEDKYGDYGIIGAIISCEHKDSLLVDTLLISCRAIGKGVEHKMIAYIGERAKVKRKNIITIPFSKTEKNTVAWNFLDSNFENFKMESADGEIYQIPTDYAINFKFDPSSFRIQDKNSDKNEDIETKPITIHRNSFYNDIIENFSNIDSIVQNIYGNNFTDKKNIRKIKNLNKNQISTRLLEIWQEILNNPNVRTTDNFFDVGGDSILIPSLIIRLKKELDITINIVDVFQYPTINTLSAFISPTEKLTNKDSLNIKNEEPDSRDLDVVPIIDTETDIAIIGLTGRFPGANNIEEFWQLIKSGKETITEYSRKELENKGVAKELLDDPNYVYSIGSITTADQFDASFFGFSPKEADFMDPQHRVFLESCHEALEIAGYSSDNYSGTIGVFAGSGPDNYILKNLFQHEDELRRIGEFQTIVNNGKDFLTTHASYKLNLDGPSLDIQTACSTSLVTIHYACNSLRNSESDIALAGGVFIHTPRKIGYMFEPGGILSPKGRCRPFDVDADGTVFGEGVGIVVLKKYQDAIKDNDTIWGVIKGSAVNNDGSAKVGYMAPGIKGQSEVITRAQKLAGVKPSDISLIEAHGTGTNLGDPIEIKALTNVFRKETQDNEYCVIGSIKANIGHLDAAAGVAGLIKTTLALKHKQIPPSINFNEANPELQIKESPFYINTELKEWKSKNNKPRIAGVSSFGIGGTNAHCILQEAPDIQSEPSQRKYHIIPVSAKSETALNNIKQNLGSYLINNDCNLSDLSFTLLNGRRRYKYRSTIIGSSQGEVIEKIVDAPVRTKIFTNPKIIFLFTGQGSQYNGMAKGLYNQFSVFKEVLDKAFHIAKNDYNLKLEEILFSEEYKSDINKTEYAQPALFVVQFGIAKLLQSFGVSSDALIGHSIGEITAACVSGLISFEDGLKLVITRGRVMQAQKEGAMLSIQLPKEKVIQILPDNIDFALQNAPSFSVVSGEIEAIDSFQQELELKFPEIMISRLKTSHAFHSRMMEPALENFKQQIADISFNNIKIPFVSNTTGTWITREIAGNADYWVNHIRSTVNFVDGINKILEDQNTVFIEVGPGISLTTLLSQFEKDNQKILSIPTIRHPRKKVDDINFFFDTLTALWNYGADKQFDNWYEGEKRKRIPLPTYPFERKRHWIDPIEPFSYHTKSTITYSTFQQVNDTSITTQAEQNQKTDTSLHQRPELASAYTPPENDVEERIVKIWQDLLGIKTIGIEDDFFELGGHSLLASKLLIHIKNEFGITLKLQNLNSDFISVKQISNLITNNSEVQLKVDPKHKIVVKKTNEITEEEWQIYVREFNSNFNRDYSKEDLIRKYTETPLGFSFHSFAYMDDNLIGAQSHIIELLDYKSDVIKVACGVDLFIKEEYRKRFTLLSDLWQSSDSVLVEHNVKAQISNPLPDLLQYNEAAQTGFQLISHLSTYVLPLTFKAVHRKLGFLDLFYKPLLQLMLIARSRNKSSIHKDRKLFKAHEYYSPYDYKTYQEQVGELKFSWLWSKITHLKIIIINDNFKSKGDIFTASKYLISKHGKKAEAITYITTNKLKLPFKLFHKHEMFIGKLLSNDLKDDFFNICNWEFTRGFFD